MGKLQYRIIGLLIIFALILVLGGLALFKNSQDHWVDRLLKDPAISLSEAQPGDCVYMAGVKTDVPNMQSYELRGDFKFVDKQDDTYVGVFFIDPNWVTGKVYLAEEEVWLTGFYVRGDQLVAEHRVSATYQGNQLLLHFVVIGKCLPGKNIQ